MSEKSSIDPNGMTYIRRHMQFGWSSLLCFLTLGIALEALHGFKVDWYLNESYESHKLTFRAMAASRGESKKMES